MGRGSVGLALEYFKNTTKLWFRVRVAKFHCIYLWLCRGESPLACSQRLSVVGAGGQRDWCLPSDVGVGGQRHNTTTQKHERETTTHKILETKQQHTDRLGRTHQQTKETPQKKHCDTKALDTSMQKHNKTTETGTTLDCKLHTEICILPLFRRPDTHEMCKGLRPVLSRWTRPGKIYPKKGSVFEDLPFLAFLSCHFSAVGVGALCLMIKKSSYMN